MSQLGAALPPASVPSTYGVNMFVYTDPYDSRFTLNNGDAYGAWASGYSTINYSFRATFHVVWTLGAAPPANQSVISFLNSFGITLAILSDIYCSKNNNY